jgi:putative hydrolase of the HAD superfamily
MTIKAIILDFGQVLNAPVDPARREERNQRLARKLDLPADELWPYLFEGEPSRRWMTGRLDWDGFWTAVLRPRGVTDPNEIESFAQEVTEGDYVLNPEMGALAYDLKGRYKLAVLSNATWTEPEMAKMFNDSDTIVTSTSVGTTKPDRAIYREVLRRLNVLPEECVYTDDLADFTAAASELGIHTHTFITPRVFREYLQENGLL